MPDTTPRTVPRQRLIDRLRAGEPAALARALTLTETGGADAQTLLRQIHGDQHGDPARHAVVVGFTGPPGVGKSTLISAYVRTLRGEGRTVAVLAVDPTSPKSGGAILGDRARMGEHAVDQGVFIRSLAARSHLGGLTLNIHALVDVVAAAGWDVIVLETVGTGQSEIEVANVADVTVVINAPGLGDEVQALKAGILEIADVLVVNKADLPGAARTEQQLGTMLHLRPDDAPEIPVIPTVAAEGEGLDPLTTAIDSRAATITPAGRARRARSHAVDLIAEAAGRRVRERFRGPEAAALDALSRRLLAGEINADEAARLALLSQPAGSPLPPDIPK
ncbi:MAG: methylmalonyl Co-A mutase-associated GTPase MeaB [Gammaproteobacteria bacterium]|nr:methylmalonyl Co-A mutase-associated GTPase MeaB [Gammaproteobacteria bacterium]